MKASDAIARLAKLIAVHGDKPLTYKGKDVKLILQSSRDREDSSPIMTIDEIVFGFEI